MYTHTRQFILFLQVDPKSIYLIFNEFRPNDQYHRTAPAAVQPLNKFEFEFVFIFMFFFLLQVSSSANTTKNSITGGYGFGYHNMASGNDLVQYDVPRNSYKRSHGDVNFEVGIGHK